jgi:hypothetical protein
MFAERNASAKNVKGRRVGCCLKPRHRDATECDVGDAALSAPPAKIFRSNREAPRPTRRRTRRPRRPLAAVSASARSLNLGSRLPTFHDEPKLFSGPFREVKDVRDGAHGAWHESLGSRGLDRDKHVAINPFETGSYRFYVLLD